MKLCEFQMTSRYEVPMLFVGILGQAKSNVTNDFSELWKYCFICWFADADCILFKSNDMYVKSFCGKDVDAPVQLITI